jgi:hypothetical protein
MLSNDARRKKSGWQGSSQQMFFFFLQKKNNNNNDFTISRSASLHHQTKKYKIKNTFGT